MYFHSLEFSYLRKKSILALKQHFLCLLQYLEFFSLYCLYTNLSLIIHWQIGQRCSVPSMVSQHHELRWCTHLFSGLRNGQHLMSYLLEHHLVLNTHADYFPLRYLIPKYPREMTQYGRKSLYLGQRELWRTQPCHLPLKGLVPIHCEHQHPHLTMDHRDTLGFMEITYTGHLP